MTRPARALLIGALLLDVACARRSDAPCERYADDRRLLEQCLVLHAAEAPDVESAHCEDAGPEVEECRKDWILGHLERPLDELLAACASTECRFFVLDSHPSPFSDQVRRCDALDAFREQCVSHALTRFLGAKPDLGAQRAALLGTGTKWHDIYALQIGSFLACGGSSDCALAGAHRSTCDAVRQAPPTGSLCDSFRPDFPKPPDTPMGAAPGQQ